VENTLFATVGSEVTKSEGKMGKKWWEDFTVGERSGRNEKKLELGGEKDKKGSMGHV